MRNSIFFFIGLITLFASCTPDIVQDIEPVEDVKVDIPFDPENENDLPSDTGGFIGSISVGDGFNIKLDTSVNEIPTDINGFNPVTISDFQTTQSGQDLFVSFNAINDITDKYTFIIYNWETQEVLGGFMLRGGADYYNYRLIGLPSETNLLIWGYINQGFGQEYLGGSWIWLNSNN